MKKKFSIILNNVKKAILKFVNKVSFQYMRFKKLDHTFIDLEKPSFKIISLFYFNLWSKILIVGLFYLTISNFLYFLGIVQYIYAPIHMIWTSLIWVWLIQIMVLYTKCWDYHKLKKFLLSWIILMFWLLLSSLILLSYFSINPNCLEWCEIYWLWASWIVQHAFFYWFSLYMLLNTYILCFIKKLLKKKEEVLLFLDYIIALIAFFTALVIYLNSLIEVNTNTSFQTVSFITSASIWALLLTRINLWYLFTKINLIKNLKN